MKLPVNLYIPVGAKLLKERENRLNRAERGRAKILGYNTMGLSGTGSYGRYQAYKFDLEVWSEYKAPYKTSSCWNVYDMGVPKVQEGNEIDVKIDADDPNIVYPMEQSVEFSWTGAMMLMGAMMSGRKEKS